MNVLFFLFFLQALISWSTTNWSVQKHVWQDSGTLMTFLWKISSVPILYSNPEVWKNFQGKTLKKRLDFELDFECLNNWAKDSKILKSLPLPPPIFHATESSSEFWPCCLFPVLEEEENRARVRWKSRERFPKKNPLEEDAGKWGIIGLVSPRRSSPDISFPTEFTRTGRTLTYLSFSTNGKRNPPNKVCMILEGCDVWAFFSARS